MADDIYRDEKKIQEIQKVVVNSLTTSYSAPSGAIRADLDNNGRPSISFTNIPTHSISNYLGQLEAMLKDAGFGNTNWRLFKDPLGRACIGAIVDGKYLDISLDGRLDHSQEMKIDTPQDFEWALIQANPQLAGKTHFCLGTNVIEITESYIDHLEMPNASCRYNQETGKIEIPGCRFAFEVVVTNEHDRSLNTVQSIESTTLRRSRESAHSEFKEDNGWQKKSQKIEGSPFPGEMQITPEDLDANRILNAIKDYNLNDQGDAVKKDNDKAYQSIDLRKKWDDAEKNISLNIAQMWKESIAIAQKDGGQSSQVSDPQKHVQLFSSVCGCLQSDMGIDEILLSIANSKTMSNQDKIENGQIVVSFAWQLAEKGGMNIAVTKTKEEYIQDLNHHIKNANESEMDAGMAPMGPGMPGYNPNNNGTQN